METDYKSGSISRDLFEYMQEVVPKKISFQIHGEKIDNSISGFEPTRCSSWVKMINCDPYSF